MLTGKITLKEAAIAAAVNSKNYICPPFCSGI